MVVRRIASVILVGALLVFVSSFASGQGRSSSYDPAAGESARKSQDGFLDFTLKRINSAETDYGQYLGDARRAALDETIESAYFWSNVVALGLLVCLFAIIAYQHRNQARHEAGAAETLAQCQRALLRSQREIQEITNKNHGLRENAERLKHLAQRSETLAAETPGPEATHSARSCVANPQGKPVAAAKNGAATGQASRPASLETLTEAGIQIGLFKSESELVAKINMLSQQLTHFEDENKVLKFGSNWWARFGHDPRDRYRYTRHAAYFNSTGLICLWRPLAHCDRHDRVRLPDGVAAVKAATTVRGKDGKEIIGGGRGRGFPLK